MALARCDDNSGALRRDRSRAAPDRPEPVHPAPSWFVCCEHRPDALDGGIETARNLPVCGLEAARASRGLIEFGGKPRTVGIEGMQLVGKLNSAACSLEPSLDRRLERIERVVDTLRHRLDGVGVGDRRSARPPKAKATRKFLAPAGIY